jgi:hypothetical protein
MAAMQFSSAETLCSTEVWRECVNSLGELRARWWRQQGCSIAYSHCPLACSLDGEKLHQATGDNIMQMPGHTYQAGWSLSDIGATMQFQAPAGAT